MNIRLPKPQDGIAALTQVGVTLPVPLLVGGLYLRKLLISRGVAMPEVAVPLDNDTLSGEQHVSQEPAIDGNLLLERDIHAFENSPSCNLKDGWVGEELGTPRQYAGIAALIGAVVDLPNVRGRAHEVRSTDRAGKFDLDAPAGMRTIVMAEVGARALPVGLFSARFAANYSTIATLCKFLPAVVADTFGTLLPQVGAFRATETGLMPTNRTAIKGLLAEIAGVVGAIVAVFREVRSWLVLSATQSTVLHVCIIPCCVGVVKCS